MQEIVSRAELVLDSLGSLEDGHAFATLPCVDSTEIVPEASKPLVAVCNACRNGGVALPVPQSGQCGSWQEPPAGEETCNSLNCVCCKQQGLANN